MFLFEMFEGADRQLIVLLSELRYDRSNGDEKVRPWTCETQSIYT